MADIAVLPAKKSQSLVPSNLKNLVKLYKLISQSRYVNDKVVNYGRVLGLEKYSVLLHYSRVQCCNTDLHYWPKCCYGTKNVFFNYWQRIFLLHLWFLLDLKSDFFFQYCWSNLLGPTFSFLSVRWTKTHEFSTYQIYIKFPPVTHLIHQWFVT